MSNYAVIMAGGVGQRFWPKGSTKIPKQFLDITESSGRRTKSKTESMIQSTFSRLTEFIHPTKIFVVTNINYKTIVKKQIPNIPEDNIIGEPFGRNTAPCIGLTCVFLKQFNQKANVLVVPSDHIIKNTNEFARVAKTGLKFTNEHGGIVTLGINPTRPETGYGYIQYDTEDHIDILSQSITKEKLKPERIYKVKTFAEKPNTELAKAFIESGDFLWNSGMFIFRVDTMLEELEKFLPDIYLALTKIEKNLFTSVFKKVLEDVYSKIKGISIDYGVMEKSERVYTIRSHFDWSDVGCWDEIYNLKKKDTKGNVTQGMAVLINSKNCLVINDQRISALIGVEDLLVIDTDNGLLVCKKGESQKVKEVVDYLRRKGLDQYL